MLEWGNRTYSISACRASVPIFSISSLLRRGLMVLASPSSYSSSLSSTCSLSRGIMMVPLDFLLPRRGRPGLSRFSVLNWSVASDVLDDDELTPRSLAATRWSTCSCGKGVVGTGADIIVLRGRGEYV